MRAVIVLALLASSAFGEDRLAAGQEGKLDIPGCAFPCVVSVPSDWKAGRAMPLILFMHGSGGSPTTWPWKDALGGTGALIVGLSYGALADAGAGGIKGDPATVAAMTAFIERVRARVDELYGVDQRHVYLSGLSMGGWATNFYGLTKSAADRYRGYAIMAAGAVGEQGVDLSVAKGLPVLVLNGEKDPNLPQANLGMPLLEKAGAIATQVVLPGEGHVPAQGPMNKPLADWLAGIARADAREDGLAAVAWTDAPARGAAKPADKLADWVLHQPFVAEAPADTPVLVYAFSRFAKEGVQSPAAKDCAAIEAGTFGFPDAATVPPLAAGFRCVRLDVTAVTAKQDPQLNQLSAPQVVLVSRDHRSATVLAGRAKLGEAALATEMRKLLDADVVARAAARSTEIAAPLAEMKSLRKQQRAIADAIRRIRETPAADDAARSARTQRLAQEEAKLRELDATYEAQRDRLMPAGGAAAK